MQEPQAGSKKKKHDNHGAVDIVVVFVRNYKCSQFSYALKSTLKIPALSPAISLRVFPVNSIDNRETLINRL